MASASDKPFTPRIVSDPLAAYFHYLVSEDLEGSVSVVHADFDCDGILDVALTNSNDRGSGGEGWTIYLHRTDGKFVEVGRVGTKAARFRITRRKAGVGRVAVQWRWGGGLNGITFYDVSRSGLRKISEEAVQLTEDMPHPSRIEQVFGANYSEQERTVLRFEELQSKYSK